MNISQLTHEYISTHPSIKDCLLRGVINYSALSREISSALDIDSQEAIIVACQRYAKQFRKIPQNERRIIRLLRGAKIRMRSQMLVAVVRKPLNLERVHVLHKVIKQDRGDFNLIEGEEVFTIITNAQYEQEVKARFRNRIEQLEKGVVQISIIISPKMEIVPGVVGYVYGLLAQHGVNIREEMSCWSDLMIVLDEKDMSRGLDVLSMLTGSRN